MAPHLRFQHFAFSITLFVGINSLYANTSMESCHQVLHDPAIQEFLDIQSLLESEKNATQIGVQEIKEDLQLMQDSPVSKIKKQITHFRRAQLTLKPVLLLGPLGHSAQDELMKPLELLHHELDTNLKELNQHDLSLRFRVDRLHTLIESNLALTARFTEELAQFNKQKKDLESLINRTPRENTVLHYAELKLQELQQSVLNLRKRIVSLEDFKRKLDQHALELSHTRKNLITIRDADVPYLITRLPPRLAMKLTHEGSLALPDASKNEYIPFDSTRFLFGTRWINPKKLLEYFETYYPKKESSISEFIAQTTPESVFKDKDSKDFLIDEAWNTLVEKWRLHINKKSNPPFGFYDEIAILKMSALDRKTFYILDLDEKSQSLLVYYPETATLKIQKYKDLSLYPFGSKKIVWVGSVNLQAVTLVWKGFDSRRNSIFWEQSSPRVFTESEVRFFDTDLPTPKQSLFALSLKDQTLHPIQPYSVDLVGQPIYSFKKGPQTMVGTLEELKAQDKEHFEILNPPELDPLNNTNLPSLLKWVGTRSNGEKIYQSQLNKNKEETTITPAVRETDLASYININHPNALGISVGSIIGAIDMNSFWGQKLKAILVRLAETHSTNEPPTKNRVDLGYDYGRSHHPYQTQDGLISTTIKHHDVNAKVFPLFAMFGYIESYTDSLIKLRRWEGIEKDLSKIPEAVSLESQTSYDVSLEQYLVMDITKGKPSLTKRYTIGDEIMNEDESTSRILASFALHGVPYILKYRYKVRPHYDRNVDFSKKVSMYRLEVEKEAESPSPTTEHQ